MIDKNEIRCGNWFRHNDNWSYREKEGNFKWEDRDWYALGECTIDLSNVFPIPLSPDILLKCGFIKEPIENGNDNEGYYYSYRLSEDKYIDLSLLSGDKNGLCEVFLFPYDQLRYKYLHQIQNIVHSITGKELPISSLVV